MPNEWFKAKYTNAIHQKELDREFPLVSPLLPIPVDTDDEIFNREFRKHLVLKSVNHDPVLRFRIVPEQCPQTNVTTGFRCVLYIGCYYFTHSILQNSYEVDLVSEHLITHNYIKFT